MRLSIPLLAVLATFAAASPALAADAQASKSGQRAVVLVSGVAATTPFTTPTRACRSGFSAGNTWAYLRDYLVKRGFKVYTAPASVGGGRVVETTSDFDGPFAGCPKQLPASMTSNAIGPVDRSGSSIARFIRYLHDRYGVTSADVVGHSLGGIIGRAGIREVRLNRVPVKVRSYTTLGSPWTGVMLADPIDPSDPMSACDGGPVCEAFLKPLLEIPGIEMLVSTLSTKNKAVWNSYQVGALKGIPVTMVAGTYFTKPGGMASKWPNDGAIQEVSALGASLPNNVVEHRRCYSRPLTHSLYVSKGIGAPDDTALTWNAEVGSILAGTFRGAGKALKQPNGVGCPPAG
jgi:triacylglycerol lipase